MPAAAAGAARWTACAPIDSEPVPSAAAILLDDVISSATDAGENANRGPLIRAMMSMRVLIAVTVLILVLSVLGTLVAVGKLQMRLWVKKKVRAPTSPRPGIGSPTACRGAKSS